MRIYLDSNVFISFARQEFGKGYRQLGTESELFFAFCRKNKIKLIFSGLFFAEVKSKSFLDKESVCEIIRDLGITFSIAKNPENLESKARSACRKLLMHFSDAVHCVIAMEENADAFITWNKKDFRNVSEFPVLTPEEFTDSEF